MKKILFFSRDPGGTNVLIPIIKACENLYAYEVWGKDNAVIRYKDNGLYCNDITKENIVSENDIGQWLIKKNFTLIVTGTSADDNFEKYLWKVSKRLSIYSIAILDQWMNYGIRFSKYSLRQLDLYNVYKDLSFLPDKIFVMDEFSRQKLIEEGVNEGQIVITGQPYLEFFKNNISNRITEELVYQYRNSLELHDEELLLVFASEDISTIYGNENSYWGYTEKTIFSYIQRALNVMCNRGKRFTVIIRPHPKEPLNYWNKILTDSTNYRMILDNKSSASLLMKSADLILGMQSMFLIESKILERNVMSVQIGLKQEEPLILSKLKLIKTIETYGELVIQLERFFKCEYDKAHWTITDSAIENCMVAIKEIL